MKPNKFIIFGNSGSGKSTQAKKLQTEYKLAHLDLDTLAWKATEPPSRKPLLESAADMDSFITENARWVIEGCYADLLQLAAKHADHAIFMNLPIDLCQQNARNRPWEPHKYASKAAQDANLDMLLEWIADYEQRQDEFCYQAHQKLYNRFPKNKQQITSNQQ